jgi:hypothetical protein
MLHFIVIISPSIIRSKEKDMTATTIIPSFEKRHIGAIARSGWIPSFRPTNNRFSRSGRTENMERLVN